MNYYKNSTHVPNEIFDTYLTSLNQASLKVLLVIIRQTLGYLDARTGNRKRIDWISITFFVNRTGLTRKSITQALSVLIQYNLVVALDGNMRVLPSSKERQGKKRIYYAYKPYYDDTSPTTCVKTSRNMSTFHPYTKLIPTKKNDPQKHQSDLDRIYEILKKEKIVIRPVIIYAHLTHTIWRERKIFGITIPKPTTTLYNAYELK